MQQIERNVYIPMPVSIVGATVGGKDNFMAVAWVAHVHAKPPMIAVSINHKQHTRVGIMANGTFSVNIPGRDLLAQTDYVGLVSGRKVDKSRLFTVFRGELDGAPLIAEAALCLECRLAHTLELPSDTLFVGEIVTAWAGDEALTDGKPDLGKMDVFFLGMPENHYYGIGEALGRAWDPAHRRMFDPTPDGMA